MQVDPRTNKVVQTQFVSPFGPQSFQLPAHAAPTFLVPPGTNTLTATAVSDVPAIVELTHGVQGIDVVGDLNAGQNGSTVSVASVKEHPGTVSHRHLVHRRRTRSVTSVRRVLRPRTPRST